jgi:DNA repair exonuclease SbcCD ATPase subunit
MSVIMHMRQFVLFTCMSDILEDSCKSFLLNLTNPLQFTRVRVLDIDNRTLYILVNLCQICWTDNLDMMNEFVKQHLLNGLPKNPASIAHHLKSCKSKVNNMKNLRELTKSIREIQPKLIDNRRKHSQENAHRKQELKEITILRQEITILRQEIATFIQDFNKLRNLMQELKELSNLRKKLANLRKKLSKIEPLKQDLKEISFIRHKLNKLANQIYCD